MLEEKQYTLDKVRKGWLVSVDNYIKIGKVILFISALTCIVILIKESIFK